MRYPKSKQCEETGKQGFATRLAAVTAAAIQSRQSSHRGSRVYPYPHCGRFHLTSQLK